LDQSNSLLREYKFHPSEEFPFEMFKWLLKYRSGPLAQHYLPGYRRVAGDLTSYEAVKAAFIQVRGVASD
jgi:hypothetical protein